MAHESLQPPGGGNGVAAWMVQALQRRHDLTLMTAVPLDVDEVNRYFGTSIDPSRLELVRLSPRLHDRLRRFLPGLSLLKSAFLRRDLWSVGRDHDLVILSSNEASLPRPGIQYVHYPTYVRPRPRDELGRIHDPRLLAAYYWMCDRIAKVDRAAIKRNLTLVNSDWTGRVTSRWYDGIATTTLYPPIAGAFEDVPWESREPGFVSVGRFVPEKRIERVIDIVAAVRRRFPDVKLHLVGSAGSGEYGRRIMRRVERERAWVRFYSDLGRGELVRLMCSQRYGIHGMSDEHFGMSVAELVRAGCIVWVPNSGGQVEIVRGSRDLCYGNEAEAVASVSRALGDESHARALRELLAPQRERFSERRFMKDFVDIVDGYFAEAREAPPAAPGGRAQNQG